MTTSTTENQETAQATVTAEKPEATKKSQKLAYCDVVCEQPL